MDSPTPNTRQQERFKVAEQAEEWLIAVEEGESTQLPALTDWLAESPLHVEMFLRATAIRRLTGSFTQEQRQLMSGESDLGEQANIIPIQADHAAHTKGAQSQTQAVTKRHWTKVTSIAAALLVTVGALWWFDITAARHTYDTAIGEQRSVQMPDGSVVYLNAHSRIQMQYSSSERNIRLVRGEALFKVQLDPSRPFRVLVNDAVVRALGTQFNIYRRSQQTTVSVIEGSVQVSTQAADTRAPLLAGQAVNLSPNGKIEKQQVVDLVQVTAWRQRQLVFERATLDTIVEEFNRYNTAPQIHIDGKELRERRYTAVFDADAPGELLKFLEQDGSVAVVKAQTDQVFIRER